MEIIARIQRILVQVLCIVFAASFLAHAGPPGSATESALQRAEELLSLGYYPKAIAELENARLGEAPDTDPRLKLRLAGLLGKALSLSGQHREAVVQLEAGLALAAATEFDALRAALLNDLGNAKAAAGDVSGAVAPFEQSYTIAGAAGDQLLAAKAASSAARALLRKGDRAQAVSLAEQASQALALAPADSSDAALTHIAIGRLLLDLHRAKPASTLLPAAYAMLSNAVAIAERVSDPRVLSHGYGYLAQLYDAEGRDDDALVLTRRAIFQAQQARSDENLYRWEWQAARIFARRKLTAEAVDAYRRGIDALWPVRLDVMADARRLGLSYRSAVGGLFRETAEILIERASAAADRKSSQALLAEARDALEQLKASELEDYFQDDCVAAVRARRQDIDRVGANTAVIYPVILPSRTELLVTLPDGIQRFTVQLGEERLGQEVGAFRRLLEKRTTHQYMPHAQRLYDVLIRPLEAVLAAHAIDTLILVPDGPLRNIPLTSLHDGKRFLVERFAVGVAPGLTLIEPRRLAPGPVKLLIAGLSDSVQKFPSLPHVEQEMTDINALHGGSILKNRSFVVDGFSRALRDRPYSVVHIASHGQFEPGARDSFLLAYDGRLTLDKLEGLLRLSRYRDEPVELLTLSACRTAAGDDRAALGLAGVAVKAGARSALATLWYVNDLATSYLVTNFYRQLAGGSASKAKALQTAQLQMLSERRFRHPGYWSPFLLIGNWL